MGETDVKLKQFLAHNIDGRGDKKIDDLWDKLDDIKSGSIVVDNFEDNWGIELSPGEEETLIFPTKNIRFWTMAFRLNDDHDTNIRVMLTTAENITSQRQIIYSDSFNSYNKQHIRFNILDLPDKEDELVMSNYVRIRIRNDNNEGDLTVSTYHFRGW